MLIEMKRVALFPGSFDPFTAGHLNILKRALTMFDEVIVAVGVNIDKRGFFSNEKKLDIIRQATEGLEGVTVIEYDNLTIDACRERGVRHIVRGVRNRSTSRQRGPLRMPIEDLLRRSRQSSSLRLRSMHIFLPLRCVIFSSMAAIRRFSSLRL